MLYKIKNKAGSLSRAGLWRVKRHSNVNKSSLIVSDAPLTLLLCGTRLHTFSCDVAVYSNSNVFGLDPQEPHCGNNCVQTLLIFAIETKDSSLFNCLFPFLFPSF
jgi:hypothetical protein